MTEQSLIGHAILDNQFEPQSKSHALDLLRGDVDEECGAFPKLMLHVLSREFRVALSLASFVNIHSLCDGRNHDLSTVTLSYRN
jgi:hypothetical protein